MATFHMSLRQYMPSVVGQASRPALDKPGGCPTPYQELGVLAKFRQRAHHYYPGGWRAQRHGEVPLAFAIALMVFLAAPGPAASITIKGKVVDETNAPVSGAKVRFSAGSETPAASDATGGF